MTGVQTCASDLVGVEYSQFRLQTDPLVFENVFDYSHSIICVPLPAFNICVGIQHGSQLFTFHPRWVAVFSDDVFFSFSIVYCQVSLG